MHIYTISIWLFRFHFVYVSVKWFIRRPTCGLFNESSWTLTFNGIIDALVEQNGKWDKCRVKQSVLVTLTLKFQQNQHNIWNSTNISTGTLSILSILGIQSLCWHIHIDVFFRQPRVTDQLGAVVLKEPNDLNYSLLLLIAHSIQSRCYCKMTWFCERCRETHRERVYQSPIE